MSERVHSGSWLTADYTKCIQVPVTKVQWYTDSPLLYAADVAGVVSLWDGRTGESTGKFYGHIAEIHDLAVSK